MEGGGGGGSSAKPLGGRAIQALLHEREGSSAGLLDLIEEHVARFEKQNCAMALNRCVPVSSPAVDMATRVSTKAPPAHPHPCNSHMS